METREESTLSRCLTGKPWRCEAGVCARVKAGGESCLFWVGAEHWGIWNVYSWRPERSICEEREEPNRSWEQNIAVGRQSNPKQMEKRLVSTGGRRDTDEDRLGSAR